MGEGRKGESEEGKKEAREDGLNTSRCHPYVLNKLQSYNGTASTHNATVSYMRLSRTCAVVVLYSVD